ncbi:hypothetical protein [Bremerella cremea]|uniref:hypothetical protein n=1 Tax=Bremerella cremea TaxID=1031537 RepID=UPI0031EBA824
MARFRHLHWLFLLLISTVVSGCSENAEILPTVYGKRSGTAGSSVNGTRALSEMFKEAGFSVRSYGVVSPRMLRSDIIVWFPTDFNGPDEDLRNAILNWMEAGEARTFVIVGRDFDASIRYWSEVIETVDADKKLDAMRQRSLAIEDFDQLRNYQTAKSDYYFYQTDRATPQRVVKNLSGPWAEEIDASKTRIELNSKMIPATYDSIYEEYDEEDENAPPFYMIEDQEVLLAGDGEPIAVWMGSEYSDSQIILINNGSFLLNLPLVNPEHRKLAGKLINECDLYYETESVAFLETDGAVRVLNADESTDGNTGWEWLSKWPLNLVGLQMAWWLIVLCFALYPIFGRPKRLPAAETSDFKKHVEAVGDLLQATDDHGYAQLRLQQYHQVMKGDAVYRRSKTRRTDGN